MRAGNPARMAILAWEHARRVPGPVVIEGVRLLAEARYLREHGCIGVAVEAPEALRAARLMARDGSDRVPEHATEREAAELVVDLRLANTGNRVALQRAVRLLVGRATLLQAQPATARRGSGPASAPSRRRETAGIER